ncbi:MAG: UDP-N-acetylmuramoyl-tripeptide--D-alanyl-D-alanine ligase [Candidatus Dormibacteraeota bacterium]|nr:UDP-N-acetylmuramoyl-tripeptide--D-alanyl-D-alanine ligase [Candidatus Dormibacteraeota bacterium]
MRLTVAEVLSATGGRLRAGPADAAFGSFHTDSREVAEGGLFFALRGSAMDGHEFVAQASRRGAAGVVVDRPVDAGGAAVLVVDDTWQALYGLAGWVRTEVAPLVVGVTGSNGKTSTKEMAAAVLATRRNVLKSEGNLNTETGLPLTLLRLARENEVAVLEMGMQGTGEIARLASLARPLVGVVTGIGTVHAEYFADGQRGIARAKGELVEALPDDGLAVLNREDGFFEFLSALSKAPVLGVGLGSGDLVAEDYRPGREGGSEFKVEGVDVRLPLAGRHQARNALAALAVGRFAGVPLEEGAAALAAVQVDHRLQERRAAAGYVVVDDAYNASPESMLAAFEALLERPRGGRLIAVLGEMRELGSLAEQAHRKVGRRAAEVFDRVAVVDVGRGRLLAEAAGAPLLADRAAAADWVRATAGPGDRVLVKASHGVALYELVEDLLR